MSIPYRHKRTLQRIGTVALVLTCILLVAWLCWVIWLQRYVVYTSNGAHLDFDVSIFPPTALTSYHYLYFPGFDFSNLNILKLILLKYS